MIMQDENVRIDQSVAVINGVTYPIRSISSIQVTQEKMTAQKKRGLFIGAAGILILMSSQKDIGMFALGFVVSLIGAAMLFLAKDDFYLKLVTNGGERKVLQSKHGIYLTIVRDSLVKAVSMAT